jgi:hypothetical protein
MSYLPLTLKLRSANFFFFAHESNEAIVERPVTLSKQGDQMSLRKKIAQNVAQPIF